MKKQTLLALTAGLAITASGISFATTQNNSLQNGSSNGTTITGYSDQSATQDQGTNPGQTNTTTSTKRKVSFDGSIGFDKVADAKCGGGKCGNTSNDQNKDKNSTTSTSGNDTTTQKS